ncbi:T9SS type A sorting domain-containing protein [Flavobacterium oreochromis]|uniref:DUF7619 domain-containing protein n=1 Tax=Flavobacterium oreochromis TaxID=2906078 RepID=UPI00385D31BA
MNKTLLPLFIFIVSFVNAQIVNIPDANFKKLLLSANGANQIACFSDPIYQDGTGFWFIPNNYGKIDVNNDGEIQVSEAKLVKCLNFFKCAYSIDNLTGIEAFTNLKYLNCENNGFHTFTNVDLSKNTLLQGLELAANRLKTIDVSHNLELCYLNLYRNNLSSLDVSANVKLLYLNFGENSIDNINLGNNILLKSLYCFRNKLLGLNLKQNVALEGLSCQKNNISNLDITNNKELVDFSCDENRLESVDVSQNSKLKYFSCSNNLLISLNLNENLGLISLSCESNKLDNLSVVNNVKLSRLACSSNLLSSLSISRNSKISYLDCSNNRLKTLNLLGVVDLISLNCSNNSLISLFIKNSYSKWYSLNFKNNPNLNYVCVDEKDFAFVQDIVNNYGYTNCNINTYCSFTSEGQFYTINGTIRFDVNSNGCDATDLVYPNLKLNISNGSNSGAFISNTTGNYSIPVQAGTHTVTPQLETPSYFTVNPTSFTASFPTQASPLIQNICITPNGTHPDLEIKIIPIQRARPGFDTVYEVFYKNKGNQVETPMINFNFDDALMDYVSATQVPAVRAIGLITWNLGMLQPFSSGSFRVTFRINKPTDVPSVNLNDVLAYTAAINDANFTDDSPNDNTFTLKQTVVNAFDPNDKTCLEGKAIDPSKIGEYVTYQIRFENTGTAAATNIVVKDMIDTAKFDVNSLQMVKASHNCYTRIKGNQVEFIFENINLPIDDANNDGYVVFKIKSLPTLTKGSTISNTANIYFDYNFPITTNTATTTFQSVLASQTFEFSKEFKLYPNPVKNVLNIQSKTDTQIISLEIYNTLGQLIMVAPGFKDNIDVATIENGAYFVKVNTENGSSVAKFVKE